VKPKAKPGRPTRDAGSKREAIAKAAAELFNSIGFDKTTIRLIAQKAQVDPKLVNHHFGSKDELFAEVLSLPPQADGAMVIIRERPKQEWGKLIVELLVDEMGTVRVPRLVGVIKSASNSSFVAKVIREFYLKQSMEPLLAKLGIDHPKERASILASLLLGLTFSDQVLEVPVGDKNQISTRKKLLAETIQMILTMSLDSEI